MTSTRLARSPTLLPAFTKRISLSLRRQHPAQTPRGWIFSFCPAIICFFATFYFRRLVLFPRFRAFYDSCPSKKSSFDVSQVPSEAVLSGFHSCSFERHYLWRPRSTTFWKSCFWNILKSYGLQFLLTIYSVIIFFLQWGKCQQYWTCLRN